ncbi:unknown [Odoribacter sp. CAG:788]|nr:unknown [Odoribacter sp. CAG:788]
MTKRFPFLKSKIFLNIIYISDDLGRITGKIQQVLLR